MNRAGLLVLLLCLAAPAQAVRPSYSYVEAAYLSSENDTERKGQGPRVSLNMSLKRALYFTGEYDQLDFEGTQNKASASAFGFGIHSLRSSFQLFLAGTYERLDLNDDVATSDRKDEGFGAQLGFRLPMGFLELGGDTKYVELGQAGDDLRYRGTLQARFKQNVALIGMYETFDDAQVDQWSAGLRIYFETGHDRPRKKKRQQASGGESQ